VSRPLTLADAVAWALENNPELAAIRQQRGIAAAAVVIADTYPFNPILESKIRATTGPAEAGITNPVSNEHKLILEVELRDQGGHRRQAARAALSRAESEIAFQEVALAVRTARAFNAVVHREQKLRVVEETVRLNEEFVSRAGSLFEQGRLRRVDYLAARGELNDSRALLSTGRIALAIASSDLRRALGSVDDVFHLQGTLDRPSPHWDAGDLNRAALERRTDLQARKAALAEAAERLRLEVANRYGNPFVGPDYEIDATRTSNIGVQLVLPLPLFNTRRGEILQRQAELARATSELHQVEVLIRQEVDAALSHLDEALNGVTVYATGALPDARNGLAEVERMFERGDPSVDFLRVVDFRRRLLKARDGYLDALLEVEQARAELAAAVGDLTPVLGDCPPADPPSCPPPPERPPSTCNRP
jgi:cobalt-zinc-cadmium efflux system outer membrane protein